MSWGVSLSILLLSLAHCLADYPSVGVSEPPRSKWKRLFLVMRISCVTERGVWRVLVTQTPKLNVIKQKFFAAEESIFSKIACSEEANSANDQDLHKSEGYANAFGVTCERKADGTVTEKFIGEVKINEIELDLPGSGRGPSPYYFCIQFIWIRWMDLVHFSCLCDFVVILCVFSDLKIQM